MKIISKNIVLWVGLFVSIVTLFFSLYLALETVNRPFYGFLPFQNGYVGAFTQNNWQGEKEGLGYHDLIALKEKHADGAIFTVSTPRKGVRDIFLTPQNLTPIDIFKIYVPLVSTAIMFILIAALAIIIKPSPPGTVPFVLYCLSTGCYLSAAYDFHTTYYLTQLLFLAIILMPAAIVHLSLEFPNRIRSDSRYRYALILLGYLLSFVIWLPYHTYFMTDPRLWVYFEYAVFIYISLAYLFWLWTLVYRIRHPRDTHYTHEVAHQCRVILKALIPGFGAIFILMWLNFIFGVPMSLNFVAPLCLVFPLAILIAMFRSNLFLVHKLEKQVKERTDELQKKDLELFQSHKLASVGLLASGTAHEIGNAMNVVSSNLPVLKKYAKVLLEKYSPLKTTDQELTYILQDLQDLVDDLEKGAFRVNDIMKNLRSFAKPETDKPGPTQLHHVIQTTLRLLKEKIPPSVKIEFEGQIKSEILAVSGQIHQVVLNLLLNALEAVDKKTGIIKITERETPEAISVIIHDNGAGISPDHLSKVFDPFFTTKQSGTGLGLSVSYGIVQKHHGQLQIESHPGQGTTLTLTLPKLAPRNPE